MSASDRGTLEKLLILAYTTPDYSGEPASQFTSYVNRTKSLCHTRWSMTRHRVQARRVAA